MTERITVIQGHPDGDSHHLGHALSEAYTQAARDAGHDVRVIEVGKLDFPLIRNKMEWENDPLPPELSEAQNDLLWAEHWALFYPIWLGAMPAMLKGFLEQVLRPMATNTLVYKYFYGAHTVKALERNILKFCGIDPVKTTLIGEVYKKSPKQLERSIKQVTAYGAKGI